MSIDQENLLALDAGPRYQPQPDASARLSADMCQVPIKAKLSSHDDPFKHVAKAEELLVKKGPEAAAREYEKAIDCAEKLSEQTLYKALKKYHLNYDQIQQIKLGIEADVAASALNFGLKFQAQAGCDNRTVYGDIVARAGALYQEAGQPCPLPGTCPPNGMVEVRQMPQGQQIAMQPIDARTGQPIDPRTGRPVDMRAAQQFDPRAGQPSSQLFDGTPTQMQPIDARTGQPVDARTHQGHRVGRPTEIQKPQDAQGTLQGVPQEVQSMAGFAAMKNLNEGMQVLQQTNDITKAKPYLDAAVKAAGPADKTTIDNNLLANVQKSAVTIDPKTGEVRIDQDKAKALAPIAYMLAMAPIYTREVVAMLQNNAGDRKGALARINEIPKELRDADPVAKMIVDHVNKGQKIAEADFEKLANPATSKTAQQARPVERQQVQGVKQPVATDGHQAQVVKQPVATDRHQVSEAKQPVATDRQHAVRDQAQAKQAAQSKDPIALLMDAEQVCEKQGDAAALPYLQKAVDKAGTINRDEISKNLEVIKSSMDKRIDPLTGKKLSDDDVVQRSAELYALALSPVLTRAAYAAALNNSGKHAEAKTMLEDINKKFPEAKAICLTDYSLDAATKGQTIDVNGLAAYQKQLGSKYASDLKKAKADLLANGEAKMQVVGDKKDSAAQTKTQDSSVKAQDSSANKVPDDKLTASMNTAEDVLKKDGIDKAIPYFQKAIDEAGPADDQSFKNSLKQTILSAAKGVDPETGKSIDPKEMPQRMQQLMQKAFWPMMARTEFASALSRSGRFDEAAGVLKELQKKCPDSSSIVGADKLLERVNSKQAITADDFVNACREGVAKLQKTDMQSYLGISDQEIKQVNDSTLEAGKQIISATSADQLKTAVEDWKKNKGQLTDSIRSEFSDAIKGAGAAMEPVEQQLSALASQLAEKAKPIAEQQDQLQKEQMKLLQMKRVQEVGTAITTQMDKAAKDENLLERAGDLWHKAWNDKQDKDSVAAKDHKDLIDINGQIAKQEEVIKKLQASIKADTARDIDPLKKQIADLSSKEHVVMSAIREPLSNAQFAYGYALSRSDKPEDKKNGQALISYAFLANPSLALSSDGKYKKAAIDAGVDMNVLAMQVAAQAKAYNDDKMQGMKVAKPMFEAAIALAGPVDDKAIKAANATLEEAARRKLLALGDDVQAGDVKKTNREKLNDELVAQASVQVRAEYARALNNSGNSKEAIDVLKDVVAKSPDAAKDTAAVSLVMDKAAKGQSVSDEDVQNATKQKQLDQFAAAIAKAYPIDGIATAPDAAHSIADILLQAGGNVGSGALGAATFTTIAGAALASIPATLGADTVPAAAVAGIAGTIALGLGACEAVAIGSKQAFNLVTNSGKNDKWYYDALNPVPFGVYGAASKFVAAGGLAASSTGAGGLMTVLNAAPATTAAPSFLAQALPFAAAAGAYNYSHATLDVTTGATNPFTNKKITAQEAYLGATGDTLLEGIAGPLVMGGLGNTGASLSNAKFLGIDKFGQGLKWVADNSTKNAWTMMFPVGATMNNGYSQTLGIKSTIDTIQAEDKREKAQAKAAAQGA